MYKFFNCIKIILNGFKQHLKKLILLEKNIFHKFLF